MSSPTLKPKSPLLTAAPSPIQLSPRAAQQHSPPPSPARRVEIATPQEKGAIRAVIEQWKSGDLDIDETVQMLLQASLRRKSFAREVYNRFVEQVRADPDQKTLIDARKALYAANIFSRYADCAQEYAAVDASFVNSERELKSTHPELYR